MVMTRVVLAESAREWEGTNLSAEPIQVLLELHCVTEEWQKG